MSEYLEIAYAVAAKRFCIFTGTGFSKALTDNAAPTWKELLERVCDDHIGDPDFKKAILPPKTQPGLQLEEAAQVIGIKLKKSGTTFHKAVSDQIGKLKLDCDLPETKQFFEKKTFRVVTTNYDNLAEDLAGDGVLSVCPGRPIPRSDSRVKALHVHGSIEVPDKMVVTSDDYFRFMEKDTYFSRKLSTLIHENTVVILGYSLGDTNLRAILNDYVGFVRSHKVSNSIFFVSRKKVAQEIIDYYFDCYGIRVIQNTDVEEFFAVLNSKLPTAENRYKRMLTNYKAVIVGGRPFKDERLGQEESFFEIIASLGAMGTHLDHEDTVKALAKVISQKTALCRKTGAWDQYPHLAKWLVYLGSLLNLRGTLAEKPFIDAVHFSTDKMSKKKSFGYSWESYKVWNAGWSRISADNRSLITQHIRSTTTGPNTLEIIDRG